MLKKIDHLLSISLLTISLFYLNACEREKPKSHFFNTWKDHYPEECFIRLIKDTTIENYVWFFDGSPIQENYLKGQLYFKNNSIYFQAKNYESLEFILFDFNLKINECIDISYTKNENNKKHYNLCLDDFFYDESKKDTIYKFYFKNYSVFEPNTSIAYFVGKEVGIIGCFLFNVSANDSILSIQAKTVGEVYPKRYNYERLPRFDIK